MPIIPAPTEATRTSLKQSRNRFLAIMTNSIPTSCFDTSWGGAEGKTG